jgi:sulfur relay (sulfurtransferase) DsrC/TusE family protein
LWLRLVLHLEEGNAQAVPETYQLKFLQGSVVRPAAVVLQQLAQVSQAAAAHNAELVVPDESAMDE